MDAIRLQEKAKPGLGFIEHYCFENPQIDLPRTLFHRIAVPLAPFDSGLEYVRQPESTTVIIEWINLGLADPAQLDGIEISTDATPDIEASLYLGGAHNWYHIDRLTLTRIDDHYSINCSGMVEFENEGVAQNERFEFRADAKYRGGA